MPRPNPTTAESDRVEPIAAWAEHLRREVGTCDRHTRREQARESPLDPYGALPGGIDLGASTVVAFMTDQ